MSQFCILNNLVSPITEHNADTSVFLSWSYSFYFGHSFHASCKHNFGDITSHRGGQTWTQLNWARSWLHHSIACNKQSSAARSAVSNGARKPCTWCFATCILKGRMQAHGRRCMHITLASPQPLMGRKHFAWNLSFRLLWRDFCISLELWKCNIDLWLSCTEELFQVVLKQQF